MMSFRKVRPRPHPFWALQLTARVTTFTEQARPPTNHQIKGEEQSQGLKQPHMAPRVFRLFSLYFNPRYRAPSAIPVARTAPSQQPAPLLTPVQSGNPALARWRPCARMQCPAPDSTTVTSCPRNATTGGRFQKRLPSRRAAAQRFLPGNGCRGGAAFVRHLGSGGRAGGGYGRSAEAGCDRCLVGEENSETEGETAG